MTPQKTFIEFREAKKHFRNSNYKYSLTETEKEIMLSISLRNKVQLSIPVYYRQYEKILPQIMATVKAYEDAVAATKIDVFIS
jgi:hypothetical protein